MEASIDYGIFARQYGELCGEIQRLSAPVRVGTLGPSGTTSEQALLTLLERLRHDGVQGLTAVLYDDFGAAYRALLSGETEYLLAPNAYEGITQFYWDIRLEVRCSYYRSTPKYGLFRRADDAGPKRAVRISSCPAVFCLLDQLHGDTEDADAAREVITVSSTEKAARAVAERRADLAVTNATSAAKYQLVPASRLFGVQMLWTVFGRRVAQANASDPAPEDTMEQVA